MYWIFSTKILTYRNQYIQAKLVDPTPSKLLKDYIKFGYKSGLQDEPYGFDLKPTFQVDINHNHPDNYFQSVSFNLYSQRLVDLFNKFEVKAEIFPAKMIDKASNELNELKYYVYHILEGVVDGMDIEKSEWKNDYDIGIPRLILNENNLNNRPIVKCNHIYVSLMRDDVKQAIEKENITGFLFINPINFKTGQYTNLS